MDIYKKAKGRGSRDNKNSRFSSLQHVPDLSDYGWVDEEDLPTVKTEFFRDHTKNILSKNNSPDLGFTYSINAYRGCEHGCSYCYARPTHEYLSLSAGFDFESKIFVKHKAPELLRNKLMAKNWKPQVIVMSGVTDCYQPAERQYQLTRGCLKVLAEFKNPVGIITKNKLVCRDIDILCEMAHENLVNVCISITSLNAELARKLEPRTSAPQARLKAVELLSKSGIPVTVNVAPIIPGLNDHEVPNILKASAEHGATGAGFALLRLPHSVKNIFSDWLEREYPEKKRKVLNAISDVRDGQLYNPEFGTRMQGTGKRAAQIAHTFRLFSKKYGLDRTRSQLRTDLFQRPGDQLSLF